MSVYKKKKKVGGENKIGVRIKYWFCWPLMSVMKSHERLVLGFRYIIVLLISFLYYENGFLYKGLTFKSKKDPQPGLVNYEEWQNCSSIVVMKKEKEGQNPVHILVGLNWCHCLQDQLIEKNWRRFPLFYSSGRSYFPDGNHCWIYILIWWWRHFGSARLLALHQVGFYTMHIIA